MKITLVAYPRAKTIGSYRSETTPDIGHYIEYKEDVYQVVRFLHKVPNNGEAIPIETEIQVGVRLYSLR